MTENSNTEKTVSVLGNWLGDIYGTHRGQAFAEFIEKNDKVIFKLRIGYFGVEIEQFSGIFPKADLKLKETVNFELDELLPDRPKGTHVIVKLTLIEQDILEGEWESSINGKGIVRLTKLAMGQQPVAKPEEPQEIIVCEYHFGKLQIYKRDIRQIAEMFRDLVGKEGSVIIAATYDGERIIRYAERFLEDDSLPEYIDGLTISGQIFKNDFNNSIILDIKRGDDSNLLVQTSDRIWFYGTGMGIKTLLDKRTNTLINFYRKHGLSLTGLLFLLLLIFLPSQIAERAVLVASFMIFAFAHKYVHSIFSLSVISPTKEEPSSWGEKHPGFKYILVTIFSAAVSVLINLALPTDWQTIVDTIGRIFP